MTTRMRNVSLLLGCVRLAATSTVTVSFTRPPFTPPTRAVTSADSTSTRLAITIPVTAHIFQLTANVIDDIKHTIRSKCVKISVDITILHCQYPLRFHIGLQLRRVLFGYQVDLPFLMSPPLRLVIIIQPPALIKRPYLSLFLLERAITTVSTAVRDSSLMHTIATRIVRRRTAERHAGTLAVCMAMGYMETPTRRPAVLTIHGEHITVCTTPSTVLGK